MDRHKSILPMCVQRLSLGSEIFEGFYLEKYIKLVQICTN